MSDVLVDTSVWVGHFRARSPVLADLLNRKMVLMHPLIIGELSCGIPPDRARTLSAFADLGRSEQASLSEVLAFIERDRLFGLGCAVVDIMLLASTLITPGARLWTIDAKLAQLAGRYGVLYDSGVT